MKEDYKQLFITLCDFVQRQAEVAADNSKGTSEEEMSLKMRDDYLTLQDKIKDGVELTKEDFSKIYIAAGMIQIAFQRNIEIWQASKDSYENLKRMLIKGIEKDDFQIFQE